MTFTAFYWIITLELVIEHVTSVPKSGPYDVVIKQVEECDGEYDIKLGGRISRASHGVYVYNSDMEFKIPLDEKVRGEIEIQQLKDGVYTRKFMMHRFKNCEQMWKQSNNLAKSLLASAGYNITRCPVPAGPYDIEIQKIEQCEDQGSGKITFGTRITKAGKGKYVYKENFNLSVPMDDKFSEYMEVQKFGNGGWRPKSIEHTFKNCEEIWNIISDFLKELMKSAGKSVDKCPIPAGSYKADWALQINVEKMIPVMEYGKYRAFLHFKYDKALIGCIIVYGEVTPKAFG